MTRVWSERAIETQKDLNRFTRSIQDVSVAQPGLVHQLLPTIVVASETIAPGGKGFCAFQEGVIGDIEPTGIEDEMWNLVSDAAINAGDICLASRIMLQASGPAGWVVWRITSSGSIPGTTYTCFNCHGDEIPQIRLQISGLIDVAGSEGYDGVAADVNGTHDLSPGYPGLDGDDGCIQTKVFQLPTHPHFLFQPAILAVSFLVEPATVRLQFNTILNLQFGHARVIYGEDTTAWPANEFPKNADSNKHVCDTASYSTWEEQNALFDRGPELSAWLANGTFTINP